MFCELFVDLENPKIYTYRLAILFVDTFLVAHLFSSHHFQLQVGFEVGVHSGFREGGTKSNFVFANFLGSWDVD